jgi:hypothetical protein
MSDIRECWSTDEETFNYDTLGELLDCNDELTAGSVVYMGHAADHDPTAWFSADHVIGALGEAAYDEAGEHAQDYPDVSEEAKAELQTLLDAWVTKYCTPTFYRVENVREYVLTEEDVAVAQ